jgi:hypothetical protein
MKKRPPLVAQQKFREHRAALETLSLPERFRYIFEHNIWSNEESRSGDGSTHMATEAVRSELPRLLRQIGATSILDIPCGDFSWLSRLDLPIEYVGADIVDDIVAANRDRYRSEHRRFVKLDLTADDLPSCDVVLCRDCLVHLSYANIRRALDNVARSGAKWILATSFIDLEENADIADGDWRPLNLELPPFSLGTPERVILEQCEEGGGAYRDKALCLWKAGGGGGQENPPPQDGW